jgi:hypothetical protein
MRAVLLFLLVTISLLPGCSDGGRITGNTSSETTNGIVAQAVRSDGSFAAGAKVRLRSDNYLSDPQGNTVTGRDRIETHTDAKGRFSFDRIEAGTYRIEISDTVARQALIRDCSLEPEGGTRDLGVDTLRPFAVLSGTVAVDTTGPVVKRYVRVFGLERLAKVDANGAYRIDDLPAGKHRIQLIRAGDSIVIPVAQDSVTAAPEDTVAAPLVDPVRTLAVRLNTTATGANVAEDVADFPLLIRLPLATATGADSVPGPGDTLIEVSTVDGGFLPFEIEHWDGQSGEASVWVRVDTVYGNRDTQRLFLRWGPASRFVRQSAGVFDTATGHFAVWHLSELPGGGVLHDATGNRYDATPHAKVDEGASVPGIAGRALRNDGRWNFVTTDTLGHTPGERFTLSVWVRPDTAFAAMGNGPVGFIEQQERSAGGYHFGAMPPETDSIGLRLYTGRQNPRFTTARYVESNWSDGWYHLAAVCDSGHVRLYHNGEQRLAASLPGRWNVHAETDPIMLGTWLRGTLDEARMYRRALSAAYVKLSYATQRPNQKVVVFPWFDNL